MSSQVTFIYIALFTIQIVSKQLHTDKCIFLFWKDVYLIDKFIF